MKIEFKVESPVKPPPIHFMEYELTVEYEHGDADGTTSNTMFYNATKDEDIELLKLDVIGLLAMKNARELYNINDLELVDIYEAQGLTSEEASDAEDSFHDKFREGDHTTDGSTQAPLSSFWLTYHDSNGEKYQMSIWVNGRSV